MLCNFFLVIRKWKKFLFVVFVNFYMDCEISVWFDKF